MALIRAEKRLLRRAIRAKGIEDDTELDGIGRDDIKAKQLIAEYVAQQTAPVPPFLTMRRESLAAQLAEIDKQEAERARVQELINELPQE